MIIIGIDNGLDGALVANDHGSVIGLTVMPTVNRVVRGVETRLREVDTIAVCDWIKQFGPCAVALEEPLEAAGSSQALRSMAMSYGHIRGALQVLDIPVVSVDVHRWQAAMLPRGPKGTSKARALVRAQTIWPDQSWIPARCRTPHDGVVDAALIAEYHRQYGQ